MDLRERLRANLRSKASALTLLDALMTNPYVTVARAQQILKVSNPAARKTVRFLQQQGILHEVSGRKWGQLFLARPIMNALERPGKSNREGSS